MNNAITAVNSNALTALSSRSRDSLSRLSALRDSLKERQDMVLASLKQEKQEMRKVINSCKTIVKGKRIIRSASFLSSLVDTAETLREEAEKLVSSSEENQ